VLPRSSSGAVSTRTEGPFSTGETAVHRWRSTPSSPRPCRSGGSSGPAPRDPPPLDRGHERVKPLQRGHAAGRGGVRRRGLHDEVDLQWANPIGDTSVTEISSARGAATAPAATPGIVTEPWQRFV